MTPYRSGFSVNFGGLALTVPNSIDCRHLYCDTCLDAWWNKCTERLCFTCKQRCPGDPVRDAVNGLHIWAREDARNGGVVGTGNSDPQPSQLLAPANHQASSAPHDASYGGDREDSMIVELAAESALDKGEEGAQELQLVPYGGGTTPNI